MGNNLALRLADLGQTAQKAFSEPEPKKGKLGYNPGTGFTVVVPDNPSKYYVLFDDLTFAEVKHNNRVSPSPTLPVLVGLDTSGEYVILDTDASRINEFINRQGPNGVVPVHNHTRGSILEYLIDLRLIQQLSVRVLEGLVIQVQDGFYSANGQFFYWPKTTRNMAIDLPSTPGQQRWCVIGINPTVEPHRLVTAYGAVYPLSIDLSKNLIPEIEFLSLGYIPLCAVKTRYGQTGFTEFDFEALYSIVGAGGGSGSFQPDPIAGQLIVPLNRQATWVEEVEITGSVEVLGEMYILGLN